MKKIDLGKDSINKLLLSFSIPCIISMLINSVYNIVDQIFIGQGVGTLGNAATNVIFPLVMLCSASASLIGNGAAANLSLRLGEGDSKSAAKGIGTSLFLLFTSSIILLILGEAFLPILVRLFGCTDNVYSYAIEYGRIILLGIPFMIIYSGLSSLIRADGSPNYSMVCLVVGAIINLILDPVFIFGLNMGVKGGALATILGQAVSFIIAILYIAKMKSIKLTKKDIKINSETTKVLSLGVSSFITQMTVLAVFVVMNNLMTKYGSSSKYGADIPLSVYGVLSKINSIYISLILGIAIGAQPIIGFNYGAHNYDRVKETLRKVVLTGFIVGIIYNIIILLFPSELASIFIKKNDPTYDLFIEFAVKFSRIFFMLVGINSLEMSTSISVQSLGNVKKSTILSFTRQIILFIPLSIILCHVMGIDGALIAEPIADILCFVLAIYIFMSEYKKLSNSVLGEIAVDDIQYKKPVLKNNIVITISREYGSGGRYVGKLLAEELGIQYYDRDLIALASLESGLDSEYIKDNEQTKNTKYFYSNDDAIFIAEEKVIKNLSKESCIIIGRCADYILRGKKNVFKVFLYSNDSDKVKRAVKYYGLKKDTALKEINKINKQRAKHYKYYTNQNWMNFNNYDIAINTDKLGTLKTAELIKDIILKEQ
ncbi:MAG: MATE family efflux transporter [Bacilli bacterium]|nr:MATE family efflux transporter [Bacilli bacterium]